MDVPGFNYRIVSQQQRSQLNQSGDLIPGWTVTFLDGVTGTQGSVFVPSTQYLPSTVQQLIEQQLDVIRGVHQLGT